MKPLESTSGKAHTVDEDYAKFSGRVVMTVSTTNYDPKRKCWIKRTYEYIDIGRADSVEPRDGDELLEYEKFKDGRTNSNVDYARIANMEAGKLRRAALRDRVVEHMNRFGPGTKVSLSLDLDIPLATLYELLTRFHTDTFCRLPKVKGGGKADLWGLVGVHDKAAA